MPLYTQCTQYIQTEEFQKGAWKAGTQNVMIKTSDGIYVLKLLEEFGGKQWKVMIKREGEFLLLYTHQFAHNSSYGKSNPSWEPNGGESVTCSPWLQHDVLAP